MAFSTVVAKATPTKIIALIKFIEISNGKWRELTSNYRIENINGMVRILFFLTGFLIPKPAFAFSAYKNHLLREVDGKPVHINTLHKAMAGPTQFETFKMDPKIKDKVLWITDYHMEVADKNGSKNLDRLLCHANIGMVENTPLLKDLKIEFMGKNDKIGIWSFLAMGQGSPGADFPKGFGLKIRNGPDRLMMAGGQFQNEMDSKLDKEVFFRFKIGYLSDKDARAQNIRPLWPTRFVVKTDLENVEDAHQSHHTEHSDDSDVVTKSDEQKYQVQEGRKLTGHWMVPSGTHLYERAIQKFDRTVQVHFITLHVHPYADWVDIYDQTANKILWRGKVTTAKDGPYLTNVEHYSSEQGFTLPSSHRILTRVQYTNPNKEPVDAMATANVYTACNEMRHKKGCMP